MNNKEEDIMADTQRRKISELRVVDLRHELEKRGLDKAGIKGVLLERLTQALTKEGRNSEYLEGDSAENSSTAVSDTLDTSNEDRSTLGEKETKNDESIEGNANMSVSNGTGEASCSTLATSSTIIDEKGKAEESKISKSPKAGHGSDVEEDPLEDAEDQNESDNPGEDAAGDEDHEEILENDSPEGDIEDRVESDLPEVKDTSDSDERAVDDDSQGAGTEPDGPIEVHDEVSVGGKQPGGKQPSETLDGAGDAVNEKNENTASESENMDASSNKNSNSVNKDLTEANCDDEADLDALRLTIGEEEEEDKNYILADEREKEKTDTEPEKNQEQDSTNTINEKVTSSKSRLDAKSKGSSKSTKGSAGSKDETTKVLESKDESTKPDASSRSAKSSGATSTDKDDATGSTVPNREKAKETDKKGVKSETKDAFTGLQKNESHRGRSRPVRRHDRTRVPPVDVRVIRRSISPRNRRSSASNHRQTLSFEHIREMRERERQREREREMHRRMRERERREREELARQREIERRNAEQLELLERERQRLRIEREKVEREKEELIRMERERQRAERERIEREKEEIRRAKLDDRSRRGHKRSYEEDRKDVSPRDFGDRKRVVVEARRPDRTAYSEPERPTRITEAVRSTRDRERLHRRRSKSRSISPGRHSTTTHRREVARSVQYPDRDPAVPDWRYDEARREPQYRPKEAHKPYQAAAHKPYPAAAHKPYPAAAHKTYPDAHKTYPETHKTYPETHKTYPEVPKEKRAEERREMRIPRDRDMIVPSSSVIRAAVPDYSSRTETGLSTHRGIGSVTSKGRSERYDPLKSDPYTVAKEDAWSRRANYSSATASSANFPSSMSSRESWLDRKSDYVGSERLTERPSINDGPDRWISGSGAAVGSGRSVMSSSHLPPAPPPPTFSHAIGPASASGSGSARMYQSDPYSASTYASKSRFPNQRY